VLPSQHREDEYYHGPSLFSNPMMSDWLVEHGVDLANCIGITTRAWERDGSMVEVKDAYNGRVLYTIITESWIEFEDPELAVLFKLRWG